MPVHHSITIRKTTMTLSGIDKFTISTTFKHASHTKACFLVIATQQDWTFQLCLTIYINNNSYELCKKKWTEVSILSIFIFTFA